MLARSTSKCLSIIESTPAVGAPSGMEIISVHLKNLGKRCKMCCERNIIKTLIEGGKKEKLRRLHVDWFPVEPLGRARSIGPTYNILVILRVLRTSTSIC